MDFVRTSEDPEAEPTLFWLFLSIATDGKLKKVKDDALLPKHIWERLTKGEKLCIAQTDSKWLGRVPRT